MANRRRQHHGRLTNWCRLGGEPLLTLAGLVEERLVPPLIERGFEWAETSWADLDQPVGGGEINLVRRLGNEIDDIVFNFDKHHRPAFQVHLTRRKAAFPHTWIRSGNLVQRPSEYLHFWGKPWWLPTRFWTAHDSQRLVEQLTGHLNRALTFLENGVRSRNISRRPDT